MPAELNVCTTMLFVCVVENPDDGGLATGFSDTCAAQVLSQRTCKTVFEGGYARASKTCF
jgi:hypothetical protein